MTTDAPLGRLRAADPALRLADAPLPPLARVAAARRRRHSRTAARAGTVAAIAAVLALALPGSRGDDVIARAAAAVSGPDVLHTVTVTRTPDGGVAGRAESWRAPDGERRTLLYSSRGELTGEVTVRDGESLSWTAEHDTVYRVSSSALDDDPLGLLARARSGEEGVTRRADTTVRGIPVHVVVLAPTRAGDDPVPERIYYLDKETFLPVRIEFGETVTDVLETRTVPRQEADLEMAPHPSATVRDFRP
jgi:hypothetical protein